MKISCCIFDLDGTLLTPQNKISEVDKSTLRKLSDDGVKIIIATGRSHLQILEYAHSLGISDPSITCNGGQIINIMTNEVLHRDFLRREDAIKILNAAKVEGTDFLFYTPDCVYHAQSSERVKFFLTYNETAPKEFRVPIRPAADYPIEEDYSNIIKILIHDNTDHIQKLEERFNSAGTLTIVSSGKNLIDIMPENTTKGAAVNILCEKLGIPITEVVAFGDSMNDESMLKSAGYSVAMGNAVPEIKQICDFVTKSNGEYGITYAIEHILSI